MNHQISCILIHALITSSLPVPHSFIHTFIQIIIINLLSKDECCGFPKNRTKIFMVRAGLASFYYFLGNWKFSKSQNVLGKFIKRVGVNRFSHNRKARYDHTAYCEMFMLNEICLRLSEICICLFIKNIVLNYEIKFSAKLSAD